MPARCERGQRGLVTHEQARTFVTLYAAGWSTAAIASRHHTSKGTVRRHLLAQGVTLRGRGGWHPPGNHTRGRAEPQ